MGPRGLADGEDKPYRRTGSTPSVFLQAPYTEYRTIYALQRKYGTKLLSVVHNNYILVGPSRERWASCSSGPAAQVIRIGIRNLRIRPEPCSP